MLWLRNLQPYSAVSAFITKAAPVIEPSATLEPLSSQATAPELYSPEAGVSEVPLKPIFQWGATAGADSYELLVDTDVSFTNPVIIKIGVYALPTTAWQSDINLAYATTYFWKVRASNPGSYNTWSAVSAFTIEPAELALPLLPESPSPSPLPEPTVPDWIKYLAGALLLTMIAILITMILLTIKVFRL